MSQPTASAAPNPAAPSPAGPARQSSPESLDQLIETTRPRGWLALWAIAGAVLIAIVWSVVATIPQQVTATGVVSSFAYTVDVTATASGIITFSRDLERDASEGQEIATITPYDGGEPVVVPAPMAGRISTIYVNEGQGVEPGTTIAKMVVPTDPTLGIATVTYVPASQALRYTEGDTALVTVTDLSTARTTTADAEIAQVANSPSSIEGMTNISGSASLAEQWMQESGGAPFRILLRIEGWDEAAEGQEPPAAGQVVQIVNTYSYIHPIEMLFGGN